MKALTSEMTTRCVGRHLLDLPRDLLQNTQSYAEVDEVRISINPLAERDFSMALRIRQEELKRETIYGSGDSSLKSNWSAPNASGLIFDRSRSRESNVLRTLELRAWRDGYALLLQIDARDMSFSKSRSADDTRQTTTPEKLAQLLDVFARTRGLAEGEVPQESGLCIANGFVKGSPSEKESMQIAFHLKDTQDVYFSFQSDTVVRENDTLLERTAKVEREMQRSGTTTVRKGKRDIQGQPVEEWLMRGPTPERVPGTMFDLQANVTERDPAKPFVSLTLFNGFRIPAPPRTLEESALVGNLTSASLSEAEAVALWDAVTPTLRKRTIALRP
ncbi:MAG: hypothetical protein H0W40_08400 [Methylibium sp.]|uniref:T6SS immunity protein Tli4 family protein n=1 Tax=Methylibium sp. TaxID=2067992 RepID=UPI0017CA216A|nr:T6SS immunity protein Tli4 family protein [Methylibium sp.]MBA3597384.1 hypothetical protein [Methylibium sp.]